MARCLSIVQIARALSEEVERAVCPVRHAFEFLEACVAQHGLEFTALVATAHDFCLSSHEIRFGGP